MGCASSRNGTTNPGSDARLSCEPNKTADIAGIIRVTIKYAKDLPSNDIGGKCDPFCTLSYGDSTYRTEVLRNNRSPTFNTTALLPVPKVQLQGPHVLRLAVYDKDRLTVNDFVGMTLIDASGVIGGGDEIQHREEPLLPQPETVNQLADAVQSEESARSRSATEHNRGRIAYGLRFMPAEEVLRDFWARLFQVVDEDGNGTLSVAEFRELLRLTAADADAVTDARLKAVFAMADKNEDGRVTMEELHEWLATPECRSILDEGLIYSMFIEACWDDSQQDSDTALLKDTFRTEKEAARGWLFRVTEWMGGSRYDMGLNVGARAKAVLIKDRSTGLVQEEKISAGLNFAMRVMYQSKVGSGLLGLGSSQALLTKMTEEAGRHFDRPQTKSKIPDFIEQYGLNTAEIKKPLDEFANFNEFFYRQLVDGCRPIDDPHDDAVAVSAADCRALFFDSVEESQQLWIKGQNFTLKALLQGGDEGLKPRLVEKFKDAAVAILRLAPQDYHRFHYGVAGVVSVTPYFLGKQYFTVNPVAINAYDVFTENKRAVTVVESREFGTVVVVAVGATLVGSINFTGVPQLEAEGSDLEPRSVKRGDEHGYFAYGGSTVIYLFEKGRIAFSNDLLENSQKQMETYVRVGNHIGRSAGS